MSGRHDHISCTDCGVWLPIDEMFDADTRYPTCTRCNAFEQMQGAQEGEAWLDSLG